MAKIIKNVKVTWSWSGDNYALRGFNIIVLPSGQNPTDTSISSLAHSYNVHPSNRSYLFSNLTLDTSVNYVPWVQAYYENDDSDWLSSAGFTVADDGLNTITVKSDIITAVENIKIGGRNLIKNSKFATGDLSQWFNNGSATFATVDGKNAAYINTSNGIYQTVSDENTIYTYSFLAKALDATTTARIGFLNVTNGNKTFTLSTSWEKYTFTTPVSISVGNFWHVYSNGKRFYITEIKVEKGNKATDWSEAPEDFHKEIDDVANSVSTLQNTMNTTFKDGIVSSAEALAIAEHLKTLSKEKADLDNQYTTLLNNPVLVNTSSDQKSNLVDSKISLDQNYNILISRINTVVTNKNVTNDDRTNISNGFNTYSTALNTFHQRINEVLTYIAESNAKGYVDSELSAFSTSITTDLGILQNQIDGVIDTWFKNYEPTLANEPASLWTTTTDKDKHLGDVFYNNTTGYGYRFQKDGSNYVWVRISDSDMTAALNLAQQAKDTADGKRRVFVSTPTNAEAYDIGDLWIYNQELYKCKTAKIANAAYSFTHWEKAVKYTDDTAVNNLIIGGRNLALGTAIDNWTNWNSSSSINVTEGTPTKLIKSTCSFTGNSQFGIQQTSEYRKMKIISGETYTLSFSVRGNIPLLNYIYLMNSGTSNQSIPSVTIDSQTEFKKVSTTFTANSYANLASGSYLMISYSSNSLTNGLWFELKEVKLEKGNKVTDWSPAPEDTYEYIDGAFRDGVITDIEALNIEKYKNIINAEKANMVSKYNSLISETDYLTAIPLGNLNTGYDNYILAYNDLIDSIDDAILDNKVTDTEKNLVNDKFTIYITKLGELSTAMEQANSSISLAKANNAVNNLSIGGRNILIKSSLPSFLDSTDGTVDGTNAKKFTLPISAKYINPAETYSEGIKNGETYTYSFLVTYVGTKPSSLRLFSGVNLFSYTDVVGWDKIIQGKLGLVYVTATAIGDMVSRIHLSSVGGTGDLYVKNFKVEKGTKVTDWTEAPEDTYNYITGPFKDGVITNIESRSIEKYKNILSLEKSNIDKKYDTLMLDSVYLTGDYRNNLSTAKTNYNNSYTTLLNSITTVTADGSVSSAEKTTVDNNFADYVLKTGLLSTAFENAISSISQAKADKAVSNLVIGGRNLYIKNTAVDKYLSATGDLVNPDQLNKTSAFIKVDPTKDYTFSLLTTDTGIQPWSRCAWYDSNNVFISIFAYTAGNYNYTLTLKPPSNAVYARLSARYLQNDKSLMKFEEGNKATAWTPAPEDVQSQIDTANQNIADIITDNKIIPAEKHSTKIELDRITADYNNILVQATSYGITSPGNTKRVNFESAYSTLNTYLSTILSSMTTTTTIVATTFRTNFKNYYDTRELLIQEINNIINTDLSDLETGINGLKNFTNTAFVDGILDMAEMQSLKLYLDQLATEKNNLDGRYNVIIDNFLLRGEYKTNLEVAKEAYDTKYNELISEINTVVTDSKVTNAESTSVSNKINEYRIAINYLYINLDGAIDSILEESTKGTLLVDKATEIGIETYTSKADDSIVTVDIDGNSLSSGNGKNLLVPSWSGHTPYNTIPTIVDIYTNKITFTMNATGYIAIKISGFMPVSKTYTVSGIMTKNGLPVTRSQWLNLKLNTQLGNAILTVDDATGYFECTQDWNGTAEWIIHANISGSINDVFVIENFQMEEGSVATSFEIPTALPNYPIPIVDLNNIDVVSQTNLPMDIINKYSINNNGKIAGRNLFKGYLDQEITLNPYQSTGSFQQFTTNFDFDPSKYIGKYFTISFYAKSPNGATQLNIYNNNGNPRYFQFGSITLDTAMTTEWKYYTYTFLNKDRGTSYSITNKLEIYAPSKTGVIVKKIKIEEGSIATDWTPAPIDISYDKNELGVYKTNVTLTEPLRKVYDISDRLFLDSDEIWKVERKIGKKVLNGTENWITTQALTNSLLFYTPISDFLSNLSTGDYFNKTINTHFKNTSIYAIDTEGSMINHAKQLFFRINKTRLTTQDVAGFKTWLASNNVTLLYQLATSTIEILPQELQDRLNNIKSYKGHNTVYTLTEPQGLKPTLYTRYRSIGWLEDYLKRKDIESLKHDDVFLPFEKEDLRSQMQLIDSEYSTLFEAANNLNGIPIDVTGLTTGDKTAIEDISNLTAQIDSYRNSYDSINTIITNSQLLVNVSVKTIGSEGLGNSIRNALRTYETSKSNLNTKMNLKAAILASRKANANPEDMFKALTNNGTIQGIFFDNADNKIYVNAQHIQGKGISADTIEGGSITGRGQNPPVKIDLENNTMNLGDKFVFDGNTNKLDIKLSRPTQAGGTEEVGIDKVAEDLFNLDMDYKGFKGTIKIGSGNNNIRNSVGYGIIVSGGSTSPAYWKITGANASSVGQTTSTWILSGAAKSGWSIPGTATMEQLLKLLPNQDYTLSGRINKNVTGSFRVDLYDVNNTTLIYNIVNTSTTYNNFFSFNFNSGNRSSMYIRITATGVSTTIPTEFTDLMLAEGFNNTTWTQANDELYTLNVRMDGEGLTVYGDNNRSKTVMNPQEFAGYYDNDKVFTVNKDITEVQGLEVKSKGLYIQPIKMIQNVTNNSLDIVWTGFNQ